MENRFVGGKEASEILGVHQRTLMNWDRKKLIEDEMSKIGVEKPNKISGVHIPQEIEGNSYSISNSRS